MWFYVVLLFIGRDFVFVGNLGVLIMSYICHIREKWLFGSRL